MFLIIIMGNNITDGHQLQNTWHLVELAIQLPRIIKFLFTLDDHRRTAVVALMIDPLRQSTQLSLQPISVNSSCTTLLPICVEG
jgi:hypothetical protein